MSQELPYYGVVDIPDDVIRSDEVLGTKRKFWFSDKDSVEWLFKRGRVGEDWAEKVAFELALLLELSVAQVKLARYREEIGTVCLKFTKERQDLTHGNEVLAEADDSYPREETYGATGYTPDVVFDALEMLNVAAPPSSLAGVEGAHAGHLFLAYLMLDTWIGNGDRHHENWGVVIEGEQRILAPTYDHAASLNHGEPEEKVAKRLLSRDNNYNVNGYVERGRSAFYHEAKKYVSQMEAFMVGCNRYPDIRGALSAMMIKPSDAEILNVLARIPDARISEPHRKFALAMLNANRQRILKTLEQL